MRQNVYLIDSTENARPGLKMKLDMAYALRESLIDFGREWGLEDSVSVEVWGRGKATPDLGPHDFPIVLLDEADEANALGYHYTNADGSPAAKVFTKTILDNGGTWHEGANSVSVCVDHEAKETKLDMAANSFAFDWHGRAWAIEACDAVQSVSYEGARGVALSAHVLPAYFTPGASGPFDSAGILTQPFSIARGGYAIIAKAGAESEKFGVGPRGFDDLAEMGFEVVLDDGNVDVELSDLGEARYGALVLDPEFDMALSPMKADAAARTMRRLAGLK